MQRHTIGTLVSVVLCFFTCSTAALAAAPRLPDDALPIPIVRQATDYSCGAAALLGVLQYWRAYDGDESSLYPLLETNPEQGTEPDKIADVARELGLRSAYKENLTLDDLRKALERGDTVILALQAWRSDEHKTLPWSEIWSEGHYGVLVAMDARNAYFMDPSAGPGYAYVPLPELLERWHDYEDRRGRVWRYFSLGIFVHGKRPLAAFPGKLVRME